MLSSIISSLRKMSFYAVARGKNVGIYKTWAECELQVKGFPNAAYKKFKTEDEANSFIAAKRSQSSSVTPLTLTSASNTFASTSTTGTASQKRPSELTALNSYPKSKRSKIDENITKEYTSNIARLAKYDDNNFMEDNEGYVHVYTDGSCENNGRANAVAGLGVFFNEGNPLNTSEPVVGKPTNNRGEIQAATKAITLAAKSGIKKLCINCDSKFLIQSVNEWLPNWIRRGWKLSSGQPIKNEQDFRELNDVLRKHSDIDILWRYVPAHKGIHGNERADELAKKGGQAYKR